MSEERQGRRRVDRFGFLATVAGALILVAILAFTLPPLLRWWDTLVVMVSLCLPAIAAGLVYEWIERRGGWDQSRRLR
ncbi:MAG: hypothetical protein H0U65_09715 [Rubrobacter sp.]|jgi:uncharacterized membrane protein|nr:hypothetical protein [Rubrobacter sp.]